MNQAHPKGRAIQARQRHHVRRLKAAIIAEHLDRAADHARGRVKQDGVRDGFRLVRRHPQGHGNRVDRAPRRAHQAVAVLRVGLVVVVDVDVGQRHLGGNLQLVRLQQGERLWRVRSLGRAKIEIGNRGDRRAAARPEINLVAHRHLEEVRGLEQFEDGAHIDDLRNRHAAHRARDRRERSYVEMRSVEPGALAQRGNHIANRGRRFQYRRPGCGPPAVSRLRIGEGRVAYIRMTISLRLVALDDERKGTEHPGERDPHAHAIDQKFQRPRVRIP